MIKIPSSETPESAHKVFVGCAGWSISRAEKVHFPDSGSHLERYAQVFPAVEINTSFYRPHRLSTYARWAAAVPATFRFGVKLPKTITHLARLVDVGEPLTAFLADVSGLGEKLGCLLVQLPPSLAYDRKVARAFFQLLRDSTDARVVIEPRHPTWFGPAAESLMESYRIARVAADPSPAPGALAPGGWPGLAYYRLHGTPRMYYSAYSAEFIESLGEKLIEAAGSTRRVWCIFDNTALDAAMPNARQLLERVGRVPTRTLGR